MSRSVFPATRRRAIVHSRAAGAEGGAADGGWPAGAAVGQPQQVRPGRCAQGAEHGFRIGQGNAADKWTIGCV